LKTANIRLEKAYETGLLKMALRKNCLVKAVASALNVPEERIINLFLAGGMSEPGITLADLKGKSISLQKALRVMLGTLRSEIAYIEFSPWQGACNRITIIFKITKAYGSSCVRITRKNNTADWHARAGINAEPYWNSPSLLGCVIATLGENINQRLGPQDFVGKEPEFSHQIRAALMDKLARDEEVYGLAIAGGGAAGAGALWDASLSGLSAVLLEKGDFASGTSSGSTKLFHAGIKYLLSAYEALNLKRLDLKESWSNFKSVVAYSRERKISENIAPGLSRGNLIYLVLSRQDRRSRLEGFLGIWLYYFISLATGSRLSLPQCYFRKATLRKAFPDLDTRNLKAVFTVWDRQTDDARFVLEAIRASYYHSPGQIKPLSYAKVLGYAAVRDHQGKIL
jgi:hypothetical protein